MRHINIVRINYLLGLVFFFAIQGVMAQPLDLTPLPNTNLADMNVLLYEDDQSGDHHSAALVVRGYWQEFAQDIGFSLTTTSSASNMNVGYLSQFDIVVINYTSNVYNKFNNSQQQAFETYMNNGGHAIGYHTSAMPRDGQWNWYRENIIVGLYNPDYHGLQGGTIRMTTDATIQNDPILTGMPASFTATDEWYAFNQGPNFDEAVVLYYVDESTMNNHTHASLDPYQLSLPVAVRHPIMWYRENQATGSRVFYTGLIHAPAGANTDFFKLTILRSAEYVAGINTNVSVELKNNEVIKVAQSPQDITFKVPQAGLFRGSLYDVAGNSVKEFSVKGGTSTRVSKSGLQPGVYFLRVTIGDGVVKNKLVLH